MSKYSIVLILLVQRVDFVSANDCAVDSAPPVEGLRLALRSKMTRAGSNFLLIEALRKVARFHLPGFLVQLYGANHGHCDIAMFLSGSLHRFEVLSLTSTVWPVLWSAPATSLGLVLALQGTFPHPWCLSFEVPKTRRLSVDKV